MIAMLATRCACGFERLDDDEEVSDHLLAAFESPSGIGTDGRVHQEEALRACSCGFSAATGDDLDAHFLAVCTPIDAIGHDGKKHEALDTKTSTGRPLD
jgi:hypothetical protein